MSYEKPLELTDYWCCRTVCPYIGKPKENGKSVCLKCKEGKCETY